MALDWRAAAYRAAAPPGAETATHLHRTPLSWGQIAWVVRVASGKPVRATTVRPPGSSRTVPNAHAVVFTVPSKQ